MPDDPRYVALEKEMPNYLIVVKKHTLLYYSNFASLDYPWLILHLFVKTKGILLFL
jgi:hypothetical protein